jgi:outer membrane receptor for ferrienterochelin and colicins
MKFKYTLMVWLITTVWGGHLMGQSVGVIQGTITAGAQPAPGIHVTLAGKGLGTVTDEQGKYRLANVPYGNYTLVVSAVGFKTVRQPVSVSSAAASVDVFMEEDMSTLDEVVITGTMKEVSKLASSIPVEVYTPTLFKKNPTPNIFESLNIINGVQPQLNCNVCNTGDIHINGLEGPYTMVLIDGMPIVSSLSTVYGLAGIPNSMVRRIEVVKGPASTLYGSEAVGGLINIITKDPVSASRIQLDVFGTSVGELNADASFSFKAGKATSLVGINHFRYDARRDINHDNFTDVTLQQRISVFNKWAFATPTGKSSSLAWRFFYEDRWGGELQYERQHRGTDIYYGESIYTTRGELIGSHSLPGREAFTVDYSYNYHHQDSYYGTVKFLADQQVVFAQLRWNKVTGIHDLLAGIPLRYTYYDDSTPGTANAEGANRAIDTMLPGIFVQDEIKFSKQFTILGGLRYDHHNVHGSIFTPRLSFKFSPDDVSVIRLTGGSGYRVVNLFTEDHAALTGSRQVIIRHALQPEQSWNGNLNYTRNVTFARGFVTLDASLFYTYFSNKIVGDFLTDADAIIYDNLDGHAVSKGITVNADASFTNGLKVMLGATFMDVYQQNRVNGGEERQPQLHAPRVSGTGTISYTFPKGLWSVDLTGRANGPMHLPVQPNDYRPEMSPFYALLNLQVTRTIETKGAARWEIYGGVKNLLNYTPGDPLMRPFDPFDKNVTVDNPNGYTFDTAYNYAPMQGAKGFLGVRWTL